jgi:hypothetical protein
MYRHPNLAPDHAQQHLAYSGRAGEARTRLPARISLGARSFAALMAVGALLASAVLLLDTVISRGSLLGG